MWGLIQSTQERSEGKGHCHSGPVGFIKWAGGGQEYEIRLGELEKEEFEYKAEEEMQEEKTTFSNILLMYFIWKACLLFGFELWQKKNP